MRPGNLTLAMTLALALALFVASVYFSLAACPAAAETVTKG
jgi:hypothetical protein